LQTIKARTIESYAHFGIKKIFCGLFVGSRGTTNRIRIISVLRNMPRNRNQLSIELDLDYKAIQHHLKVLEKNNLVITTGNRYGLTFCVSSLFENNEFVFDEIVDRLKNS
jgi:predicted transcriptional regulator